MTDEERLSFFKDIITLVRPEKIRWKAADWENPTQWVSRGRRLARLSTSIIENIKCGSFSNE
jgi:hypothetical protein